MAPFLAVAPTGDNAAGAMAFPHGVGLQHAPPAAAAPMAALLQWRLAREDRALGANGLWTRQGRVLATEAAPAAAKGARDFPVPRLLHHAEGAQAMLSAALAPLPTSASLHAWLASWLARAQSERLPQVIAVPDIEQANALVPLLMRCALERDVSISSVPWLKGDVRILAPASASAHERALERLHDQPTLVIATSTLAEAQRVLGHLAAIHALPAPSTLEWLQWLAPLGVNTADLVEEIVPHCEHNPAHARLLILSLIERAGAAFNESGPVLAPRWPRALRDMVEQSTAYIPPRSARLARLLAASPEGLNLAAVEQSAALAAASRVLETVGAATRRQHRLMAVTRVAHGSLREERLWLAERPHFCPESDPDVRQAWELELRLRSGDLSAWGERKAAKLLGALIEKRRFELAGAVLEAHAFAAGLRRAGPPEVERIFDARNLSLLLWPPRRLRRMLKLWLRGYFGPWRGVLLALLAQAQRTLGGTGSYDHLLAAALEAANSSGRVAREQALVECALCVAPDNPSLARQWLDGVGDTPARSATLLTRARALLASATAEFVSLRGSAAVELLQRARDALSARAPEFFARRVGAEIDSLLAMYVSVLSGGARTIAALLEPLHRVEAGQGGIADLIARALVNDRLFHARRLEVGILDQRELESVLALARPHNRRGYLVLLNQLSENAVYRLEFDSFARLGARIEASLKQGVVDHVVAAACRRHTALEHAHDGNLSAALRAFRSARGYMAPPPWNRRAAYMRHGEWGFLCLAAGKFDRAARTFLRSCDELGKMDVRNRVAVFLPMAVLCTLLAGRTPRADLLRALETFAQGEFVFAGLISRVVEAALGQASFTDALNGVMAQSAPHGWRALALCAGAVLARRGGHAGAPQWASAARNAVIDRPALRTWLEREFPAPRTPEVALSPAACAALALLHCPPTKPLTRGQLAETVTRAALSALQATSVLAGVAAEVLAVAGNSDGVAALQAFALGTSAARRDGRLAATALTGSGCWLAAAFAREAAAADLAALEVFAARLDEMSTLSDLVHSSEGARQKSAALGHCAWALAQTGQSPVARLASLAELIARESGADEAALALVRGKRTLMASAELTDGSDMAVELEAGLHLRLRARGGSALAQSRLLSKAAHVVAAWMRAPQAGLAGAFLNDAEGAIRLGGELLGVSEAAGALEREVRRYAPHDLTVVITGEAGAGKDFAARALHLQSRRAGAPHVVIDCATLRAETAASELFGHVHGAFTGAVSDHVGLMARANGGTLQLDNVAELPPAIQAMLLRALEEREINPLGATRAMPIDVRLIVTTTRTLAELVAARSLRPDFAQRLSGLALRVPPLRERAGDVPVLAQHFLAEQAAALGARRVLTRQASDALAAHDWPGNVRELRATIARAAALCDGEEISARDLGLGRQRDALRLTLPHAPGLKRGARLVLGLAQSLGEITPRQAAETLGVSRTTASLTLAALAREDLLLRKGRGRATKYVAAG